MRRAQSLVEYMLIFAFLSLVTVGLIKKVWDKLNVCVSTDLSKGKTCL